MDTQARTQNSSNGGEDGEMERRDKRWGAAKDGVKWGCDGCGHGEEEEGATYGGEKVEGDEENRWNGTEEAGGGVKMANY